MTQMLPEVELRLNFAKLAHACRDDAKDRETGG